MIKAFICNSRIIYTTNTLKVYCHERNFQNAKKKIIFFNAKYDFLFW